MSRKTTHTLYILILTWNVKNEEPGISAKWYGRLIKTWSNRIYMQSVFNSKDSIFLCMTCLYDERAMGNLHELNMSWKGHLKTIYKGTASASEKHHKQFEGSVRNPTGPCRSITRGNSPECKKATMNKIGKWTTSSSLRDGFFEIGIATVILVSVDNNWLHVHHEGNYYLYVCLLWNWCQLRRIAKTSKWYLMQKFRSNKVRRWWKPDPFVSTDIAVVRQ